MSVLLKGCHAVDATTPELRRDRYAQPHLADGQALNGVPV